MTQRDTRTAENALAADRPRMTLRCLRPVHTPRKPRPGRTPVWLSVFVVLALLLTLSIAGAQPTTRSGEAIEGEITFTQAHARDASDASATTFQAAVFDPHSEGRLAFDWSLTGEEVVVNWTHTWGVGVANPLAPGTNLYSHRTGESQDERTYRYASAESTVDPSWTAQLLAVANATTSTARMNASVEAALDLSPSNGQTLSVGRVTTDSTGSPDDRLQRTHDTTPGNPILRTQAASHVGMSGDFTLFVWQANVTIRGADAGPDTYRAGQWAEQGVGSQVHGDGVVYEAHGQLLALHVTNGTLDLRLDNGRLLAETASLSVSTQGETTFDAEDVRLETRQHVYATDDKTVTLAGDLHLNVTRSERSNDMLWSEVYGRGIALDLPPSDVTRREQGAGDGDPGTVAGGALEGALDDDPSADGRTAAFPTAPSWVAFALWTVGLLVAVGLVGWWALHHFGVVYWFRNTLPLIVRAEHALVEGDTRRARRYTRRLLKEDPEDLEAWFIHGASLAKDGAYGCLIEELTPVASRIEGERADFAFLLALAHVRTGDERGALDWLPVAGEDPGVLKQMYAEPDFAGLRDRPAWKRLFARSDPDAAYM